MNDKAFKETEYYLYNHKNLEALNNIADIKIKALKNDISLRAIGYNFLMTLDEYQKQIIELRYFTKPKTSWISIAQQLNKSEPQCQRDKNQLVDQLYKLINR